MCMRLTRPPGVATEFPMVGSTSDCFLRHPSLCWVHTHGSSRSNWILQRVRGRSSSVAGDPNAITALFFFLGIALPAAAFGIAAAVLLARRTPGSAPRRPPEWPARLAALACFSALAGAAATWVSDGIVGALPGAPAALFGVGALTAFAVSSACHAAWRLAGAPLAALLVLLFIPVGVPAAGGPFGSSFVPSWYADLGNALPAGAALPAVRDVVSFGGHALAAPLLVLSLWAGISAILSALPPPRRPGRSAPAPATGIPASTA